MSIVSQGIGFDELASYFHLPINQVSKELGVCATVLKKICRRNGIPRWPHRKIKSLDRMIKALENTVASSPDEQDRINKEIAEMRNKKLSILRNPNHDPAAKYKPAKKQKAIRFSPYDDEAEVNAYTHILPGQMISRTQEHNELDITSTVSEIMSNIKARNESAHLALVVSQSQSPLQSRSQFNLPPPPTDSRNFSGSLELRYPLEPYARTTSSPTTSSNFLNNILNQRNVEPSTSNWSNFQIPPLQSITSSSANHSNSLHSQLPRIPLPVMEPTWGAPLHRPSTSPMLPAIKEISTGQFAFKPI